MFKDVNVHLITPIIWLALLITFQICRSNYNILAKVIPKSFSASHVFIFCSSSFNFMVYSTSRFLLPMRMTLHLDTLTNCLYRRFAVYPAQQVGELLTQRKSGHASSAVFCYNIKNETFTNKAAQKRQCSINQCRWNQWWRSGEETKLSERVGIVESCDSHASTRVGKHSSARVSRKNPCLFQFYGSSAKWVLVSNCKNLALKENRNIIMQAQLGSLIGITPAPLSFILLY